MERFAPPLDIGNVISRWCSLEFDVGWAGFGGSRAFW
jgi:hypothetical protein